MDLLSALRRGRPSDLASGLSAAQVVAGAALAEIRLGERQLSAALVNGDAEAERRARALIADATADRECAIATIDSLFERMDALDVLTAAA